MIKFWNMRELKENYIIVATCIHFDFEIISFIANNNKDHYIAPINFKCAIRAWFNER